jgi:hypothetical protein
MSSGAHTFHARLGNTSRSVHHSYLYSFGQLRADVYNRTQAREEKYHMVLDSSPIVPLVRKYLEAHGLEKVFPKSQGLLEIIDYNLSTEGAQDRIEMLEQCAMTKLDRMRLLERT